MTDRTYAFAGISKLKGKYKVRFSDRATYAKNLQDAGNTEIDLLQLPEPMTKMDAVRYLLVTNYGHPNESIRAALQENLVVREDRARAKDAPIDDPIAVMKEICARLKELNELVAKMTNIDDEDEDDGGESATPDANTSLEDQPF